MTVHDPHRGRTQRLNRTAIALWVVAVLFMVDGFAFQTLPAVVVAVVATIAGCWFANEADA